MVKPRDFLPQPPWQGPPIPRGLGIKWSGDNPGRAREIAMNTIATLSQKYATPEPLIIFMPMEETEAHFREPSTIQISDTFGEIVDTAKEDEWDKFLRAVIAHEFKHYLQFRESGRPFETIPEKEYEPLEREAGKFGFEFGGISLTEFAKKRAMASSIGVLYFVEEMPMEKAIRVAKEEFPIL